MRLRDKDQHKATFDRLIELMRIGAAMEPDREMLESKPAGMTVTQWHEAMAAKAQTANLLRVEVKRIYTDLKSDSTVSQYLRSLASNVLHLVNLSKQDYTRHIEQANKMVAQIADREGWVL